MNKHEKGLFAFFFFFFPEPPIITDYFCVLSGEKVANKLSQFRVVYQEVDYVYTLQKCVAALTLAAVGEGPVEPELICLLGEEGAVGILDLQAQLGSARASLFCCRPGGRAAGDIHLD